MAQFEIRKATKERAKLRLDVYGPAGSGKSMTMLRIATGIVQVIGGRIIAIGTTVVRALESAANADGSVRAGDGVARERIVRETPLRVVDAILTGVHQPGESHFELLRAFATDAVLSEISVAVGEHGYHPHEFGDSMLIERCPRKRTRSCPRFRPRKTGNCG